MLSISWNKTPLFVGSLYAYADGEFVGRIKSGHTIDVDMQEGSHVLMVSTARPIFWKISIFRWLASKTKAIHIDVQNDAPVTVNIQAWYKFLLPHLGLALAATCLAIPLVVFVSVIPFLAVLGPIIFATFLFVAYLIGVRFFPIKHTIVDTPSSI